MRKFIAYSTTIVGIIWTAWIITADYQISLLDAGLMCAAVIIGAGIILIAQSPRDWLVAFWKTRSN